MQKQGGRVGYRRRLLWALRNKTQNTTVIRTSHATVGGVDQGGNTDLSKIQVPVSAFTTIESD